MFLFSLLSNLVLSAEKIPQVDESMPWMLPWLLSSLALVGVVFWAIYKAMKSKNPKYGYVIVVAILLMVGLLFL
jgi:uncharacterized BrkB/YihY/UPF0761 family membrane protein